MAKTYFVSNESDILNPGDRPFRSLEKAQALAAKAAEECSWICLTPPGPDNDRGNGNFMCGVMSPHGIHIRESENGYWGEEHDVPEEEFRPAKRTQRADWALHVIIDRGTGYLGDGEDVLFYAGPEQTGDSWDQILKDIAGEDEIVETTVRPTSHGRYSHLAADGYPLEWEKGYGF